MIIIKKASSLLSAIIVLVLLSGANILICEYHHREMMIIKNTISRTRSQILADKFIFIMKTKPHLLTYSDIPKNHKYGDPFDFAELKEDRIKTRLKNGHEEVFVLQKLAY